jgi:dihydroflavonol-4-reductase
MSEKVFVTGGTGFVGTNLIRLLLEQGYSVRALARSLPPGHNLADLEGQGLEWVLGDLLDDGLATKMRGCRGLFHVAAHYSLWQKDYPSLYQSNVLGTRQVLAAARAAVIERVVYTSSVAALGVKPNGEPADESYQSPPEKLIGAYKRSKYWAEQEAKQAAAAGQNVVIVNPSTPVGPWDSKPTPTGDLILRFLRRRMPVYVNTGLNLIDARDVAWGHLLAYQKGRPGERYILGRQNLSLLEILQKLAAITGLPAPTRTVPLALPLTVAWVEEKLLAPLGYQPTVALDGVKMSAQKMYYDSSRAVRELGLPQSSIEQALADAVAWYRERRYV